MTVLETLAHDPTVAHYLRFINTTVGRDKVLRTLQYFARFYAWYLLRINRSSSEIAPWSSIKSQFAQARKMLSVGKNIEHLKTAAAIASDKQAFTNLRKSEALLRSLGFLKQISYAVYLSYDTLVYLHSSGLRKSDRHRSFAVQSQRAWVSGLVCSISSGLWSLRKLNKESIIDDRQEDEGRETKELKRTRATLRYQLIQDICDITIPLTGLGILQLNDGVVGLAGTVSSLMGLRTAWQKTG